MQEQNLPMSFCPISARPKKLLSACPAYQKTDLVELTPIGAVSIIAKNETARMRLGSFKALGGVYAVAQLLSEKVEDETGKILKPEDFLSDEVKNIASSMTFVCASAGNHGLSVAAGARIFGAKARIHLARSVPEEFAARLQSLGAEVAWSGDVYEESMDAATRDSEENDAILLADGSWPGYTYPPSLVMEGYTIMAEEMRESFEASGKWPTHVFLQAGVGGLAASIAYMIRENWAEQPQILIVEPDAAPCLRESVANGDMVTVSGPVSNMGRLDCKTPSIVALESLRKTADQFVAITDDEAVIAQKFAETANLKTTPSGAAGLGAVLASQRLKLELPEGSRALVIISEGSV